MRSSSQMLLVSREIVRTKAISLHNLRCICFDNFLILARHVQAEFILYNFYVIENSKTS